MIRAKWLYSELPVSLDVLSKKMLQAQYSENTNQGFLLSKSTKTELAGRYIEKVVDTKQIEDPFGETTVIQTVEFYVCRFVWTNNSKLLCILDPPKSIRKFVNKLHDMIGFGLVISELNIDPLETILQLEKQSFSITLKKISSFGIKTGVDNLAKISVSGTKDVRKDFFELVKEKYYRLDLIKFVMLDEQKQDLATCEMTKSGLCKLLTDRPSFILAQLRVALEDSKAF
jgi:hypothetical protein